MPQMLRVSVLVAALLAGLCVAACERPPVAGPPAVVDDDRVLLDLPSFLQDRPAIGGKWYDYSVDGHVLEPKSEAWILKDDVDTSGAPAPEAINTFGFRIASVYDDDSGETGLFTLEVVRREGAVWTDSELFTAPANVKDGAPVCVDLGSKSGIDCDDDGWQLRFTLQSRLSVFAAFAVAEPAVFLADGVLVARVDGLSSLSELPDPATLQTLDDEPAFDSSDWDFSRYAADLPVPGRVLGSLARAEAVPWDFVSADFALVRWSVARVDDDTLRFSLQQQPIGREDLTIPKDLGDSVDVDVNVGALPVFVSFSAADLLTPAADLAGSSWPLQPPFAKRYDLVIEDDAGTGELQLLLSPATAALHLDP